MYIITLMSDSGMFRSIFGIICIYIYIYIRR